jgi:hypothetical protein
VFFFLLLPLISTPSSCLHACKHKSDGLWPQFYCFFLYMISSLIVAEQDKTEQQREREREKRWMGAGNQGGTGLSPTYRGPCI